MGFSFAVSMTKAAKIFATVVVFPVPGPPEIIEIGLVIATAAATFCQLVSASVLTLGKS